MLPSLETVSYHFLHNTVNIWIQHFVQPVNWAASTSSHAQVSFLTQPHYLLDIAGAVFLWKCLLRLSFLIGAPPLRILALTFLLCKLCLTSMPLVHLQILQLLATSTALLVSSSSFLSSLTFNPDDIITHDMSIILCYCHNPCRNSSSITNSAVLLEMMF